MNVLMTVGLIRAKLRYRHRSGMENCTTGKLIRPQAVVHCYQMHKREAMLPFCAFSSL